MSPCSHLPPEPCASPARCRCTAARSRSKRLTATPSPCSTSARSDALAARPLSKASRSERWGAQVSSSTRLRTCISESAGPPSPTAMSTRSSSFLHGPPPRPRRCPLPPRTPRGRRPNPRWLRRRCRPRSLLLRRRLRPPRWPRPPRSGCGSVCVMVRRERRAAPCAGRPADARAGVGATWRRLEARRRGAGARRLTLRAEPPCRARAFARARRPRRRRAPLPTVSCAARIGYPRAWRPSRRPREPSPPFARREVGAGRSSWRPLPCSAVSCSASSASVGHDPVGRPLRRAVRLI
jgi:hypothetical protein